MKRIFLAIFLVFSLATQSATLCVPVDNDHPASALSRPTGKVRVYDTDFDNDRRGLPILAGTFEGVTLDSLVEYTHPGARHLDFFASGRELFELYGVLRI